MSKPSIVPSRAGAGKPTATSVVGAITMQTSPEGQVCEGRVDRLQQCRRCEGL